MLDSLLYGAWAYLINDYWRLGLRLPLRQSAPILQQAHHLLDDFIQVRGWTKGLGMFGNMH